MDEDYYNSDLRKALVLFGLLDGLLFILSGYLALRRGWAVIDNADAAGCGHLRTMERLIADGVDVNATSPLYGLIPLGMAVGCARPDVARLLLENGAEPDTQDDHGLTPTHRAVKRLGASRPDAGDRKVRLLSILDLLIKHGADLNVTDKTGKTPLHDAAGNGHPEVVRLLLEHGADVNATDNEGHTPLYHAARGPEGNEEIIALLR